MIYKDNAIVESDSRTVWKECNKDKKVECDLSGLNRGDTFFCFDNDGEYITDDDGNTHFEFVRLSYDSLLGPVIECKPVRKDER